ncbi:MAG: hypothetical protein ACRCWJ_08480 [Casimicrobium sp.]
MNSDRHRTRYSPNALRGMVVFAMGSLLLTSCAVIETTASVAKTTASVVATTVETTASVAKTTTDIGLKTASTAATIGGAAVSAGSATVSAGAAARTASAATASVAIAGATAVAGFVKWGIEFSRENDRLNDRASAPLTPRGNNEFVSKEGAVIFTSACDDAQTSDSAKLVRLDDDRVSVDVANSANSVSGANAVRRCAVVSIQEAKG